MHTKLTATTLLLSIVYFALCSPAIGQNKGRQKIPAPGKGQAETTQWWIAVRGGVNLTSAEVSNQYFVFSNTQAGVEPHNKQYGSFNRVGTHFGFQAGFEFLPHLSVHLLPSYSTYLFDYESAFNWASSDNPLQRIQIEDLHTQKLHYIELPLIIRYELLSGKFKPFIQAGGYVGRLLNAVKDVESRNTDFASGAESRIEVNTYSTGIEPYLINTNLGIMGGVGMTYNVGNARIGLEVNYKMGMNNINKPANRFMESPQVSGMYDVTDDFSIRHLELAFSCLIPLKFITSKDYIPL
ncbi:MAG: outer membrane beta-barrel protein [Cyclobacteriaceae bacterium]